MTDIILTSLIPNNHIIPVVYSQIACLGGLTLANHRIHRNNMQIIPACLVDTIP